jgi:cysteine-rich repeat protein
MFNLQRVHVFSLAVLAFALAAGSCRQAAGLDDLDFSSGGAGGAGAPVASSSSSSSGAASTASSTSAGSGGSGGGGGGGGAVGACGSTIVALGADPITITDTISLGAGTNGSCGGAGMLERVYEVTPEHGGTLTAKVEGSFDKVIYIRSACEKVDEVHELACDTTEMQVTHEQWVKPGTKYYVYVDGDEADGMSEAPFTLTLSLAVCGDMVVQGLEECDDGNEISGDGCIGCLQCTGANNYQNPADGHCYYESNVQEDWATARAFCRAYASDLAAVSSLEERDYLDGFLNDGVESWVGGMETATEGTFEWTHGEAWSAAVMWSAGEPDNENQGAPVRHCLAFHENSATLDDRNCQDNLTYVCERHPASK